MSKRDQEFKPLSLAQHFEAPEDFRGCFGWICGYSADADFLDDATERFTRQTRAQRAHSGHIALALMLDPGNSQISLVDAPGVAHLPIKSSEKPFRLLHAKIAILGFCHETDNQRWELRLIVSTGNWTRGTLEDSLDLAWRVDLSSEDLRKSDNAIHQVCADIRAAWGLLGWLGENCDTRILTVPAGREGSESVHNKNLFESWIKQATEKKTGQIKTRFFDNRGESLLGQLPAMIEATGVTVKRNYIAMGSGFYEAPSDKNAIPLVLSNIVNALKDQDLLTAKPDIDIFVNPKDCQAVATCAQQLESAGFVVRPAWYLGKETQRSLHAKFIFSANCRDNSNSCNSAWLYLGSGNLTGTGFGNKMSSNGGNLEAGVVFAHEDLYWKYEKDLDPVQVITNVLPVQWESVSSPSAPLSSGDDMPERDTQFIAAPVAWLLWIEEAGSCWLEEPDRATPEFAALNENGEPCPCRRKTESNKQFCWSGRRPREVKLCWKTTDGKIQQSAVVPVLDEYGRLAATTLPQIDLDEAWWQLANFPMPPDDDDLPTDDDQGDPLLSNQKTVAPTHAKTYPIRQMMQLIENIAAKQTAVSQADWRAWRTRLEQCLIQASSSSVLRAFVEQLKINPLSPLWESPFRPEFAETSNTREGKDYENVLKKLEEKWAVASLKKIGSDYEANI